MRQISHPLAQDISLAAVLYALSDPVRIEIVRLLYNGASLTCGQLNGERPKSSMSYHFKVLREAGLICTRTEGKEHYNVLRKADLEDKFPGVLGSIVAVIREAKHE